MPSDNFGTFSALGIAIGRVLQYNIVNSFIYYIMYWPYRHQIEGTFGLDINNNVIGESELNEISYLN